jgi:hypothetical protein
MRKLIEDGTLNKDTLVWCPESEYAKSGWVRAEDTELADLFGLGKNDGQAEQPKRMEESDSQGGVAFLSGSGQKAAAPRTKPRPNKKILALAAVLLIAAGTAIAGYLLSSGGSSSKLYRVEEALPAVPGAEASILLRIADASSLRSAVSALSEIILTLSDSKKEKGTMDDGDLEQVTIALAGLDEFEDFLDTVGEMALLIVPSDAQPGVPPFYLAYSTNDEKFNAFIMSNRSGKFIRIDKWETKLAGNEAEAWVFRPSDPELAEAGELFALKRKAGAGSLVLMARSPKEIEEMTSTLDRKSPALAFERNTGDADFAQIKIPEGFAASDLRDKLKKISPSGINPLMPPSNKILWTVSEFSWSRKADTIHMESYSDYIKQFQGVVSNLLKVGESKILGDGSVACYTSIDTGVFFHLAFPDASDPVREFFKIVGGGRNSTGLPPAIESDIMAILNHGRFSFVCVAKDRKLSTAYVTIETDAQGAFDRIFPMAGMFVAGPANIPGWDSASSTPLPNGMSLVMARKSDALLAGVGDVAAYGKSASVPKNFKDYLSPGNIGNSIISSEFIHAMLGLVNTELGREMRNAPQEALIGLKALRGLADSFDSICGNMQTSGKGVTEIVLKEGAPPLKEMIAEWSSMISSAAGAGTESSESAISDIILLTGL